MATISFPNSFDAMWSAMESARVQVRVNKRDIIEKALSSGFDFSREETDQGRTETSAVSIRLKASEETDRIKLPIGDVIEARKTGDRNWIPLRIAGRNDSGGIIVLTMGTPYE